MSEKLNDVKKLLTEYINKHNGTLYVYESLLVCFCQPYMIIYEDDPVRCIGDIHRVFTNDVATPFKTVFRWEL